MAKRLTNISLQRHFRNEGPLVVRILKSEGDIYLIPKPALSEFRGFKKNRQTKIAEKLQAKKKKSCLDVSILK